MAALQMKEAGQALHHQDLRHRQSPGSSSRQVVAIAPALCTTFSANRGRRPLSGTANMALSAEVSLGPLRAAAEQDAPGRKPGDHPGSSGAPDEVPGCGWDQLRIQLPRRRQSALRLKRNGASKRVESRRHQDIDSTIGPEAGGCGDLSEGLLPGEISISHREYRAEQNHKPSSEHETGSIWQAPRRFSSRNSPCGSRWRSV